MPLPINKPTTEIAYHNFKMLDDQTLRIRSFDIADTENYLKRVGRRDNIRSTEKATYDVLRSCVHPDDAAILDTLDRINIIYLVILLRVHSVSGLIPYPHSCPNCETSNREYKMEIVPNIKYTYEPTKKIVFTDDFEINLQNLPFSKELELSLVADEDERNKYELYYRVVSFRFGDEIVGREKFSVDEFNDWLHSAPSQYTMTVEQYLQFIATLDNGTDKIRIEKADTCVACGHALTMVLDDFSFFITA